MVKRTRFLVLEWNEILQEKLDELFKKINDITKIEDIGFHKIQDDKLRPIYKTKMGELSIEEWRSMHDNNPVYIKNNPILQEVVDLKKTIAISDTRKDNRTTDDVNSFNIHSLMMIPIIDFGEVTGVIPIVSIDKGHCFDEDEIDKCEALVKEYLPYLI